jgi:D-alanyl-lipoteichoic acid acyltransferase DltB (MBOAT superfamily)
MSLLINLLILVAAALLIRLAFPGKLRRWAALVASILAIYWLQSALPIRQMDFWFPTATVGLVLAAWGLTAEKEQLQNRQNWLALGLTLGTVILIALTRFISLEGLITPTRPPQFLWVALVLAAITGLAILLAYALKASGNTLSIGLLVLLLMFLVLKNPYLSTLTSTGLRSIMAQDPALAKAADLGWLGFSYVAFRLIHTLIDRMNGRLKEIGLDEIMIYTIFFPAFLAGPLDRLQRFRKDLNDPQPLKTDELLYSGKRLSVGLFRKFIVADTLAFFAISAANASQVDSTLWLWIMVAAYSFQLFFDFAGYTDIAIAAGALLGFSLPENFNQPYRQPNLTLFWNNWHMTLTQWFRAYFFNPLTRSLRRNRGLSPAVIILVTQLSTMIVIGLWHGVTRNFLIWGAWHGIGLFIHNRWSSFAAPKLKPITDEKPWLRSVLKASGVVGTFMFVSLGWVWFALPSTQQAWQTLLKLFGLG